MRSTDALITSLQEEHHILISGITEEIKKRFKDEVQDKYCDTLVEHLGRRFPDLPLIKAFQLFDSQQMPYSEHDNYGNDFISELFDHYDTDRCSACKSGKACAHYCRPKISRIEMQNMY